MAEHEQWKLDFLQSCEKFELFNKLCDKAKQYWLNCLYCIIQERGAQKALHFIWETEEFFNDNISPIEQIFGVCFLYLVYDDGLDDELYCFSQYRVDIDDTYYLLDFYVEYQGVKYAIELDGYEYHSTKSQINHDYEREQNLIELGYKVLRFTGTQIYNSAYEYALKALKIILKNSRGEDKNAK